MSLICFKDGVLAADTSVWDGAVMCSGDCHKLVRLPDGSVAAACGRLAEMHAFHKWSAEGFNREAVPKVGKNFRGVVLWSGGLIEYRRDDMNGVAIPLDGVYAWGTGEEFAEGCMAAGQGAIQAITSAIANVAFVGGHVEHMTVSDAEGGEVAIAAANVINEAGDDWKRRRGLA